MTHPLFFGDPSRQLFGVYHAAADAGDAAERAVVLCAPSPQEYMPTHWAYRRLAALLARAGVHVLRFDYFGMGDSAGASDEGTLDGWLEDIAAAERTLRELSGARRTSLVGYRLGAVLAWRACKALENRPRDLVLWDPVVRGADYLTELHVADRRFASRLLYFPPLPWPAPELVAHPLSTDQRLATESVDLAREPLPAATRVHMYVSRETADTRRLAERLGREVKRFSFAHVPEEGAQGTGSLLSARVLQVISTAVSSGPA
jgi:uncharacterized protein